jgi:hypothetical protein
VTYRLPYLSGVFGFSSQSFWKAGIDSVVAFQHLDHVKKAVISARRQGGGATLNAFSRPFG